MREKKPFCVTRWFSFRPAECLNSVWLDEPSQELDGSLPSTPKYLQDRIDEKSKKINGYKKNTEEIWLLIVTDRRRPSQKFIRPPDFPIDSLSSPFARTFYYGYAADDEVIEF